MQIIKSLRILFLFLLPLSSFAQSSYIMPGTKSYQFLDRLEIRSGTNALLNFSSTRPFNRRLTTQAVEEIDSLIASNDASAPNLSAVDKYNMDRFLMNNSEWSAPRESFLSKKPVGPFYTNPANFYEYNTKDFFLAVNPLIQYQYSKEKDNSQKLFYNSRGVSVRGLIGRKVGFDIYITDNQERDPLYVQQFILSKAAVPGTRFYKNFKAAGGVDYFDNRASVSFNASKYIDIQFGYDKNFIGNGVRSLFLSDFSGSATFLKINTRIWKLNYENLYMELIPTGLRASDNLLPRKYFRMNYLTMNATKWLNVGVFDAVMFGRKDHFDFQYLNPVLFLRPAESDIGSSDNAMLGLTVKANVKKHVQLYGQLLLDEFKLKELKDNRGWWANKYGYQIGVKYVDAFGIKNLDVQLEDNRIRPFTYSHNDSIASFTHFNQPLAHPVGAGLQETIGIIRYQPINKLYLEAKLIHFYQGLDTASTSLGSNPSKLYTNRTIDPSTGLLNQYGYYIGNGNKVTVNNLNFLVSYELKENMFVDVNLQNRKYSPAKGTAQNTTIMSLGFRWNMARRNFDF
ncbi:MAG: hypothetical protein LH478_12760 [Chitinophagaceae bacterium]|nr:hypothetical protein [Chitinophagaceae bacterium]